MRVGPGLVSLDHLCSVSVASVLPEKALDSTVAAGLSGSSGSLVVPLMTFCFYPGDGGIKGTPAFKLLR